MIKSKKERDANEILSLRLEKKSAPYLTRRICGDLSEVTGRGRASVSHRPPVRPRHLKEHVDDKTTSLLVQISNRMRILVMLQIMRLNISYQLYVITKISAIISRYLTAKVEQ